MAKLSAHGSVVGTIDYIRFREAICSDGMVLRNFGAGWKRHAKLLEGIRPEAAVQRRQERLATMERNDPFYADYRKQLFEAAGALEDRVFLHTAVTLLGNDPDGLCSDLEDSGRDLGLALEDCVKLCRAYDYWGQSAARQKREAAAARGVATREAADGKLTEIAAETADQATPSTPQSLSA